MDWLTTPLGLLSVYLVLINLAALLVYGSDKRRARKGKRRISEKTLFALAAVGGSIGAIAGMYLFRHKTRHGTFRFGLPAILLLQILLAVLGIYYLEK